MAITTKTIVILTALIILGFILPQTSFAIGQMTKPIVLKDVLRGQTVESTLILYNSEEKEVVYQLIAEGGIKNWTAFYLPTDLENPISEIKILAKSNIKAVAKFTVPKDTPNGEYTGEVAIVTLPEKKQNEGISASVGLKVGREVLITVTDKEIIKFETTIIPLKYGVGKGELFKIKVIYDNQGNVTIKPDLHLKIIQIRTGNVVHNAIYPYPEGEELVRPLERKIFENLIEWQTAGQENGKYRAEIKVLLDGKTYKEESFRFTIGVDIEKLLAAVAFLGGGNLTLGWFIIGAIFLIIAGILTAIYKNPNILNIFKIGIEKIKSLL